MPTVRITTDQGHHDQMKWAGAPTIDRQNHIERSIDIPEEAYQKIEASINQGYLKGEVRTSDGCRYGWFLDRK
jgi:hypothetical protein